MSRIGSKPISVPQGVTVSVSEAGITVSGAKGTLDIPLYPHVSITQTDDTLMVVRAKEDRQTRAFHGLTRSLLAGAVIGVVSGYSKRMKVVGTGYRVQMKGSGVTLAVGLSHTVDAEPLPGVTLKVEGQDTIVVEGIDKQAVGQMAANLRAIRPPEPYKGKGVRYEDEYIKLKPGKTAASA